MCRNSGPPLIGRPISFPWHGMRSDIEHNDRQNRRLVDAILDGADAKPIKELEAEMALRDPHHDRGGLRRRPGFGEEVRIIPAGGFTIELRGELAGILAVAETAQKGSTSDRDKALQIKMVAEGSRTNFPSAPASSRDCRLFPIWRSLARRAAPSVSRADWRQGVSFPCRRTPRRREPTAPSDRMKC